MNVLVLFVFSTLSTAVYGLSHGGKDAMKAVSYLEPNRRPAAGYEKFRVRGKVVLTQQGPSGLTFIRLEVDGLPLYTTHGFHIHVYGDIISNGCQSTGGHYNPYNKTHGGPRDRNRHVGDLGNVWANSQGKVSTSFFDNGLVSLFGRHSVIGRSFVLHAKRDDLGRGMGKARAGSLKTGNAGARLSCGVIVHVPSNT